MCVSTPCDLCVVPFIVQCYWSWCCRETTAIPIPQKDGVDVRKRLCWTLFIHAKSKFNIEFTVFTIPILYTQCSTVSCVCLTTPKQCDENPGRDEHFVHCNVMNKQQ